MKTFLLLRNMNTKPKTLLFFLIFFLVFIIIVLAILPKQKKKNKLWVHMVYTEIKNHNERQVILSHGLFNQLYSLFHAVDLANLLERELVTGSFYVHFMDVHSNVSLSKVLSLQSLGVPTSDWGTLKPIPSKMAKHTFEYPANALEVLKTEKHIEHLEIGCLFNFSVPSHVRSKHIQHLRFHPLFYDITSSFLQTYPVFQVIHYRMEGDYCGYFHRRYNFNNTDECMSYLFHEYQKSMKQYLNPDIPTLVVSHYYKDPLSNKTYNLPWKNLVHFSLSEQQKKQLCHHLGLPCDTTMREIDAIFDFILSTSNNVKFFIGCKGSTFSESIEMFWNKKHCVLVDPVKK